MPSKQQQAAAQLQEVLQRMEALRRQDAAQTQHAIQQQESATRQAILMQSAINSKELGISGNSPEQKLIVSLTTFSLRIETVYLAIESLFQQTRKADKIILWLDEEEFSEATLPRSLKMAQERGLEIGFCKNYRSYKKLIPTLKAYPDDIIITFDDDAIYNPTQIDRLYRAYQAMPDCIHCFRARKMAFAPSGNDFISYNLWENPTRDFNPSHLILPIGVSGICYFPGCFHQDILKDEIFLELAPYVDDLWFKTMALANGVKSKVVPQSRETYAKLLYVEGTQSEGLWMQHNSNEDAGNNVMIKLLFDKYDVWDTLRADNSPSTTAPASTPVLPPAPKEVLPPVGEPTETVSKHQKMVQFQANEHTQIETQNFENKEDYVLHLIHTFAYTQAAELASGKRALDLGCNVGYGSEIIAKKAKSVCAVDVSEDSIAVAKEKYADSAIEFSQVNGETLPFEDDAFDFISSYQVIEHIVDYGKYLGEIQRVLAPDGVVMFTTPNANIRLQPGAKPWNSFHVREFHPDQLQGLLKQYFPTANVFGMLSDEKLLYSIEYNRAAERKYGSTQHATNVDLVMSTQFNEEFMEKYSVENFYYAEKRIKKCLDLLAVCSNKAGNEAFREVLRIK